MKTYDLRSDTVTLPSREMRKAMAQAEVGDDVYGEDPSINKLQELACKVTGKRDALFLPSGSMGNLIPLLINGGRGNEVLTQKNSHILHYELASAAALAGVLPVAVEGERGVLKPEELQKHLRPPVYYMPKVSMVEMENTHNREGGTCYTFEEMKAVRDWASKQNLKVHLDGARIFNAGVSTDTPVKKLASTADTITFCLSKGLGAPVGSVLCGSPKFIGEAKRMRKLLGAGMRQAGILAAAGIYALEHNVKRLREDHANAKRIAETLEQSSWAAIDSSQVETNIIYFSTMAQPAEQVVSALKRKGILCGAFSEYSIRMVTHLGISGEDTDQICSIIRDLKIKAQ